MATKKKEKLDFTKPIFTWGFKSSQPHGGQVINYVAQINNDESVSCNCPGWVIKRAGKPRQCKHTRRIDPQVADIIKQHRAGTKFEVYDSPELTSGAVVVSAKAASQVEAGKFNRVVDI